MAAVTKFLYSIGEISGEDIFIDGTKIEAYANKYTFVWKKATTKNMEKLLKKLAAFVESCEEMYGLRIVYQNKVTVKHLKKLRKKLYRLKVEEGIEFVHGTGKRKSPLQKSIETLEQYLDKLKEYTQKLYVCGDRNSYSKTDHDATFMRMKEDAMGNGQLKAGYNIQHGVDSEYITWLTVGPQPTDTTTLIPFFKDLEEYVDNFKYKRVTADAGYESEENYAYLEKEKKEAFIKPANYEIGKKRSYQNDIGRAENMKYDPQEDTYTCHNGKRLKVSKIKKEKTKTGYERETTVYSCADCSGCPYKKECIKGNHSKVPFEDRTKNLYVSRKFNQYRKDAPMQASGHLTLAAVAKWTCEHVRLARCFAGIKRGHPTVMPCTERMSSFICVLFPVESFPGVCSLRLSLPDKLHFRSVEHRCIVVPRRKRISAVKLSVIDSVYLILLPHIYDPLLSFLRLVVKNRLNILGPENCIAIERKYILLCSVNRHFCRVKADRSFKIISPINYIQRSVFLFYPHLSAVIRHTCLSQRHVEINT